MKFSAKNPALRVAAKRCATLKKQSMKNASYILLGLLLLLIYSCNKDDDSYKKENQFYWNQTLCADPWNTGQNDSNEETKIAVKTYLLSNNINVLNLDFDTKSPLDNGCESCGCGTGQRIIVEVKNSNIDKMEELGFYQ